MAYVVARPNGRFEVRESLHTALGPRARSLVGFHVLTNEALAAAAERATRPFDAAAVIASARRAGAAVAMASGTQRETDLPSERFVAASRRMARSLRARAPSKLVDPGAALIDLLGFADAVTASQPARPFEPLEFPVLPRLVEARRGPARRGALASQ